MQWILFPGLGVDSPHPRAAFRIAWVTSSSTHLASAKKIAKKKPRVGFKEFKPSKEGPKGGLNPQPLPPHKLTPDLR
jgi:hypothetical protein